jgi:uroporphyrinogen-III synthase
MGLRVLVTRPQPEADATAERLRTLGHEPVLLPLTRIVPLMPQIPDAGFDAVAATSANAVRHASREPLADATGLPFFAVGDRTGEVARAAGFADVHVGEGDAAALGRLVAERLVPGTRLLYLCGRMRKPDFERALSGTGIAVNACETYDTVATSPDARVLAESGVDAVLVYSANAARQFLGLASPPGEPAGIRPLCISMQVASLFGPPWRPEVAAAPTEEALLALLAAD